MKVTESPRLDALNSFRVSARASLLIEVETEEDVLALPRLDSRRDLVLGGGSNVLLVDDVPGTVILCRIRGIHVVEEQDESLLLEVAAGEDWHALVMRALHAGWHGLENLALIPGLAGAAPIQNIGAYGVELASVLESVTAWDWAAAQWRVFTAAECALGYRDSRFRTAERDRFLLTSIRLRLSRRFQPRLDYAELAAELKRCRNGRPGAAAVLAAVVRLRQRKLPDPAIEGNAGSFFKNPVVGLAEHEALVRNHPDLPAWPHGAGGMKLPAAWMIQHCGFKGRVAGRAAVSGRHALVLVNRGQATGAEIWALACEVRRAVEDAFGLRLEPEPRIYAASRLE